MDNSEKTFSEATARARLDVPDDLKDGTLQGFIEIDKLRPHLRPKRHAESEPASFFVPRAFLRDDD